MKMILGERIGCVEDCIRIRDLILNELHYEVTLTEAQRIWTHHCDGSFYALHKKDEEMVEQLEDALGLF